MAARSGYVVWEDREVTGILTVGSRNEKTGDCDTLWILPRERDPLACIAAGEQALVCGTCPLQGAGCYVQVGQAPMEIWAKWQRGGYPWLPSGWLPDRPPSPIRMLRLGGWGDPCMLPAFVIDGLALRYTRVVGYTHGWADRPDLRQWCMASVDDGKEMKAALAQGWSCFVIRERVDPLELAVAGAVTCPAETRGIQCNQCALCGGRGPAGKRPARVITIGAHGFQAKKAAGGNYAAHQD